jgi:hypothetical protein
LLEPRCPKVARLLRKGDTDVLTYLSFPSKHWRTIRPTNARERVNPEIDRRAHVVGIFPNSQSLLRLATAVLQEQPDVSRRTAAPTSPSSPWRCWTPPTRTASPTLSLLGRRPDDSYPQLPRRFTPHEGA